MIPASVEKPTIHHGEALAFMRTLPARSVHLIFADPPYFRVKGEAWDRQWDDAASFLAWIGELADEWRRILAPNGSLYCCASPQMAARVECVIADRFVVLNSITWVKDAGWHRKAEHEALRSYFPATERVVFAAHCNPIGEALSRARRAAGLSRSDVARTIGCDSRLVQKWEESDPDGQHSLVTPDAWDRLALVFGSLPEYVGLVRPFTVSFDVPYTDVWTFPTVQAYPGKHPCEKPREMLDHVIAASSRPGDVVLDPFLGSGVTGERAVALGRRFIGCEMGDYIHGARRRIAAAIGTPESAADVNTHAPANSQLLMF